MKTKVANRVKETVRTAVLLATLAAPPAIINQDTRTYTPLPKRTPSTIVETQPKLPVILQPSERETERMPKTLTVDFFGKLDPAIDRLMKTRFSDAASIDALLTGAGVKDPTTRDGLKEGVPQTDEEAAAILLKGLAVQYQNHGERVTAVGAKTGTLLGVKEQQDQQAGLMDAISMGEMNYDRFGNPSLDYYVDAAKIDQIISRSDASVIGLSFEMGEFTIGLKTSGMVRTHPEISPEQVPAESSVKVSVVGKENKADGSSQEATTYTDRSGKKYTKEEAEKIQAQYDEREVKQLDVKDRDFIAEDGYAGEATYSNLKLMAELAGKNKGKFFVVAGGNPVKGIPDIRSARKQLTAEGLWPENILVVGVEGKVAVPVGDYTIETPYSYGADIYVTADDIGTLGEAQPGSSFAVPVVKQVVSRLWESGITDPKKIKSELDRLSSHKSILDQNNIDYPYRVLNLQNAATALRH